MKKIKLFCILTFISSLFMACASLGDKNLDKDNEVEVEEKKVEEKAFITNGYAGDCPKDYSEFRLDGVKYGKIEHVIYHSNTCKMDRPFSILLPADYDGVKKYPVVYFQHGIFGDENCIIRDEKNRIRQITANLAADGKAPEMIFVFGHMFASDDPNQKPGFR